MKQIDKKATFGQQVSKVTQLTDALSQAISREGFLEEDSLSSINQLSAQYGVSRDTVFKTFLNLCEQELIDSTPGKSYCVTSQVTNILLLLDQYTPFKEALYNSSVRHLLINYKVDLLFHQCNERLFNTIFRESIGEYNKCTVMNFNNKKFSTVLNKINPSRLLPPDFGKFEKEKYSHVCQDFDGFFYQTLSLLRERLKSYRQFVFLFLKSLKHPQSSKIYFTRSCRERGFLCEVQGDTENLIVHKGIAYIAIKQQDIVKVVKQGGLEGLKCRKDSGLLAYNDIPSYEVIDEGITSLSVDWEMMGNKTANFVLNNVPVQKFLPTEVRLRKSL